MLVCSKCGHKNDPSWMRCGNCLKPLRSGRDLISGVCPACGFAMMPTEVACLRCARRKERGEAIADEPMEAEAVPAELAPIDRPKPSDILKSHARTLQKERKALPPAREPQSPKDMIRNAHFGLIVGLWGSVALSWLLSANGQPTFALGVDAAALAVALTLAQRANTIDKGNAWIAVAWISYTVVMWLRANMGGGIGDQ